MGDVLFPEKHSLVLSRLVLVMFALGDLSRMVQGEGEEGHTREGGRLARVGCQSTVQSVRGREKREKIKRPRAILYSA